MYLGKGVVRRADTNDNHNVLGADLGKYQLVQPGDLVFWSSNGTQSGIYHVAMYLGGGQMIEAPTFGYTVRVTSMRYAGTMPYAVRL